MIARLTLAIISLTVSAAVLADNTVTNTVTAPVKKERAKNTSISSNPAAVNITAGTGDLQKWIQKKLKIKNNHGINFTGAWIGDTNRIFSGGIPNAQLWTSNSLFLFDMTLNTEEMGGWKGGLFGTQILQFNGAPTNRQAGVVQGYNSLTGPSPLNRFELYQLWYRQILCGNKLYVRLGKQVPTYDFDNVIRPVPLNQDKLFIPAVSGLIFTPLFVNASTLGVMPGYYNSVYGATFNFAPVRNWYAVYGVYDGNLAQGVQTGIKAGPTLNGSYFNVGETGFDWLLGNEDMPGGVGIGAWDQDGLLTVGPLSANSATGFYVFGNQRLWYKDPADNSSGISMFYQYGDNNSSVMPMKEYVGGGLTAFGLIPHRLNDSIGVGIAYSWLNQLLFTRANETIYQAYYQMQFTKDIFAEPVLSYIPHPAGGVNIDPTWAGTFRLVALF